MFDKVVKSLESQKVHLSDLLTKRDELEVALKNVSETILQIRGSIAALEYVRGLEVDEQKEE